MAFRRGVGALALVVLLVSAGCIGPLVDARATPATVPDSTAAQSGYAEANVTGVPMRLQVLPAPFPGEAVVTSCVAAYLPVGDLQADGPGAGSAAGGAAAGAGTPPGASEDEPPAVGNLTLVLLVSSPNAAVAGVSLNPLAHVERAGLLREQGSPYGIPVPADLRSVAATDVRMLGTETNLTTYEAGLSPATLAGLVANASAPSEAAPTSTPTPSPGAEPALENVSVRFHVASVEHGGDVVAFVGISGADPAVRERLVALAPSVQHPTGEDAPTCRAPERRRPGAPVVAFG
jgi:hypothetical protein